MMDTNNTLEKTSLQLITSSHERGALYNKFKSKIIHNPCLDRTLVSFQANRETQFSWFKYREGFSEKLVTYLIETLKLKPGALLDPFAGVGTSLFTASDLNWQTIGIELLPVGVFAIEAKINARTINVEALSLIINQIKTINFNVNIIRMIRNYFYEMCFVIYELARVLKPGGVIANFLVSQYI